MTAPDVKVCALPACSRPLVRRDNERLGRFKARAFCSRGCSMKALHTEPRAVHELTKVCAWPPCGVQFGPTSRGFRDWEARKFCSAEHARVGQDRRSRPKQTHCAKGLHELTPDNVYESKRPNGSPQRRCKACTLAPDTRPARTRGARKPKPATPPAPAPVSQLPPSTYRWLTAPGWSLDGPVIPAGISQVRVGGATLNSELRVREERQEQEKAS